MLLFRRFIYSDGSENGGGAAIDTPAGENGNNNDNQPQSFLSPEELKQYGFDSRESLLSHLQQHKENSLPDSEKAKQAGIEKAELMKFSVENDLMKPEDFTKYESLTAKADRDLVFERFSAEQKEDNPEITDEELKENFESTYKLSSDNEKAKQRGLAKITAEAKELRSPLESSFNAAKERFTDDRKMREAFPKHQAFMDGLLKEALPEKYTVTIKDGDTEVPVEVEITKEIREKAEKAFKNEKTFYSFLKSEGKTDELKKSLAEKINGFLIRETHSLVANKIAETFKGIGAKSGSNIGAEQPFAVKQGGQHPDKNKPLSGREGVMKNQMELRDKVPAYN